MGFAGGDPQQLSDAAGSLDTLSGDLSSDALAISAQGKLAARHVGEGQIVDLAEAVLAAVGGAVVATATVVAGLSQGSRMAADQLVRATSGVPQ